MLMPPRAMGDTLTDAVVAKGRLWFGWEGEQWHYDFSRLVLTGSANEGTE